SDNPREPRRAEKQAAQGARRRRASKRAVDDERRRDAPLIGPAERVTAAMGIVRQSLILPLLRTHEFFDLVDLARRLGAHPLEAVLGDDVDVLDADPPAVLP